MDNDQMAALRGVLGGGEGGEGCLSLFPVKERNPSRVREAPAVPARALSDAAPGNTLLATRGAGLPTECGWGSS